MPLSRHPGSTPAVLLFGGMAIARYRALHTAAVERDVRLLVIDADTPKHQRVRTAHMTPGGALANVREAALVEPTDLAGILTQVRAWASSYEVVGSMSLKED